LSVHDLADTDIAERISAGYQPVCIELADRSRQFVPQLLCSTGQRCRIDAKSAEFFDNAYRLARPIEIGIDDSTSSTFHDAGDYMTGRVLWIAKKQPTGF
jgi:hypothetical protein